MPDPTEAEQEIARLQAQIAALKAQLQGSGKDYEVRDTLHLGLEGQGSHDVKAGASYLYHQERSRIDTFQYGLFTYLTDTRAIPIAYLYGDGSSDVTNHPTTTGILPFRQLSLRLTKSFHLVGDQRLDVIAEAFNVTNTVNYDVSSIDGAQYLSGPTLANPSLPFVVNPNFGKARATLPAREIQLGLRWAF